MKCRYCYEGTLNTSLVTGKIVFCDQLSDGVGAMSAGAVGTVMPSDGYTDLSFAFPLPTSCLDSNYTTNVHEYINSTRYFSNSYSPINLIIILGEPMDNV